MFSALHIQNRRKAFTLTELAIVLAVFGVILGGIWAYVSAGNTSAQVNQLAEEVTIVVANVRAYYGGQIGAPNQGYGTVTSNLLSVGTIPAYMQRSPTTSCTGNPNSFCADTPWGANSYNSGSIQADPNGTFRVCNWNGSCASSAPGSTSQQFGIMLTGLSQIACQSLVVQVTSSGPHGIQEVSINGTLLATVLDKPIAPVRGSDAITYCAPGAKVTSTVIFVYGVTSSY